MITYHDRFREDIKKTFHLLKAKGEHEVSIQKYFSFEGMDLALWIGNFNVRGVVYNAML